MKMNRFLLPTFVVLFVTLSFANGGPGPGHAPGPCDGVDGDDLQLCDEDQEVGDVCLEGNSSGKTCQECVVDGGSKKLVCTSSGNPPGRKKRSLEELVKKQKK